MKLNLKKIRAILIAVLMFAVGVLTLATPEFLETMGIPQIANALSSVSGVLTSILKFLIGSV